MERERRGGEGGEVSECMCVYVIERGGDNKSKRGRGCVCVWV